MTGSFKVKVVLRLMVSQPFYFGVKPHLGPEIKFCHCQFWVCRYGVPSLTREWVCHLQLLLTFASAVILRSEPAFQLLQNWLLTVNQFALMPDPFFN
jgi:hypothetical protein